MNESVHVFVGRLASRAEACLYTEQQWEPEPDESASDEEYEEWEDRNPTWMLKEDLNPPYLSPDFIETITTADRFAYLGRLLTDPQGIEQIEAQGRGSNTLVLIFSGAFAEFPAVMRSTPTLRYLGEFGCDLHKWRETS
ncbi:MAG TPA: hypothetical protein VGE52_14410 [Pirellulales bacterium]